MNKEIEEKISIYDYWNISRRRV